MLEVGNDTSDMIQVQHSLLRHTPKANRCCKRKLAAAVSYAYPFRGCKKGDYLTKHSIIAQFTVYDIRRPAYTQLLRQWLQAGL